MPQPDALWPSPRNVFRQRLNIFSSEYYQILIATSLLSPYYLRNGESYGFQILQALLWAQSEHKPIKNSGKVAGWALSGTPENFQGAHTLWRIARSSLR